jgi:hypothetical protein
MMFIDRWQELWPRFAQDDIFKKLKKPNPRVRSG